MRLNNFAQNIPVCLIIYLLCDIHNCVTFFRLVGYIHYFRLPPINIVKERGEYLFLIEMTDFQKSLYEKVVSAAQLRVKKTLIADYHNIRRICGNPRFFVQYVEVEDGEGPERFGGEVVVQEGINMRWEPSESCKDGMELVNWTDDEYARMMGERSPKFDLLMKVLKACDKKKEKVLLLTQSPSLYQLIRVSGLCDFS